MTYKFTRNPATDTNLYFQRDTAGLPVDKLRCFWPMRSAGGSGLQEELMGNAPLRPKNTAKEMLWSPSNPCGGQLGSCNFSTGNNGWSTSEADNQTVFATNTTPWAITGWVRMVDVTPKQSFLTIYDTSQRGIVVGSPGDAETFHCLVSQSLTDDGLSVTVTTTDTFSDNTWAFFACGMDGTNAWAVINGGTPTTATCTVGPPTGLVDPALFGMIESGDFDLVGNLADIAYWYNQGSFTASQLADLYNSGNGNTLLRG